MGSRIDSAERSTITACSVTRVVGISRTVLYATMLSDVSVATAVLAALAPVCPVRRAYVSSDFFFASSSCCFFRRSSAAGPLASKRVFSFSSTVFRSPSGSASIRGFLFSFGLASSSSSSKKKAIWTNSFSHLPVSASGSPPPSSGTATVSAIHSEYSFSAPGLSLFRPCTPTATLNTIPGLTLPTPFGLSMCVLSENSIPSTVPTFFVSFAASSSPFAAARSEETAASYGADSGAPGFSAATAAL
mmetsp:Transcript_12765/g.44341  ORF Transcript_12765/g.44341 Transcript_12765/m.44341 type:complete len:246 (-) Transcript_12765:1040-1777(-)